MQRVPFEMWAPSEIQRLRQESGALLQRADNLTATLQEYIASTTEREISDGPDAAPSRQSVPPDPAEDTLDAAAESEERNGRGPNRSPKYQAIFDAMETAGAQGMNQEDMAQAAESKGHSVDRNALRPFVWGQRKAGRFVALENHRYILARFAQPERQKPNGSASPDEFTGGG